MFFPQRFFLLSSRFIRTQAVHERLTAPNKKKTNKNKDFFRFQEIIDCCLYFAQQSNLDKQTTGNAMSTVNLLIARTLTTKEQQIVDKDGTLVLVLSRKATNRFLMYLGVTVQHIDDFHRRWRQLTPEK
jgi:hypothetical protein